MELLDVFVKNKKGVEILESPFDSEFVAKIKSREKESKLENLVNVDPIKLEPGIVTDIKAIKK